MPRLFVDPRIINMKRCAWCCQKTKMAATWLTNRVKVKFYSSIRQHPVKRDTRSHSKLFFFSWYACWMVISHHYNYCITIECIVFKEWLSYSTPSQCLSLSRKFDSFHLKVKSGRKLKGSGASSVGSTVPLWIGTGSGIGNELNSLPTIQFIIWMKGKSDIE